MNHRTFGRLGWQVSEIGFGAWAIGGSAWGGQDDDESVRALHQALDLGCNFIDTAQGYGDGRSERIIGRVLRERRAAHPGERIYVATKVPPSPGAWPPSPYDRIDDRLSEAHLRAGVERSLRDLGVEAIDLLQIHTWTRAWNRNPAALHVLRALQKEGKLLGTGVSTPEHDQNSLIDPMKEGLLDAVQVIYNIFQQEPAAEFLPVAREHGVGVIVRVAFDEGSLTGKFTEETTFAEGEFRQGYFAGDRLARTVRRVEKIRAEVGDEEPDLATAALKFALKPEAVSTVIPGIRSVRQAEMNCVVGSQPPLSDALAQRLRSHAWTRGNWYKGKD
ncbi:Predicted oxidoreductase [Verrucomicrobium sp. GAS474]|uniref:aldo/keto reductase n=1 Tax=Verrucomicrobium sp. GAS474 TaxID=1882831 RepID=UPI00087A2D01|nr:aldo/keto reductase [Verrucomicrobium sp. GAS474]SDT96073.1 Predicted oxidoreductase [Verrucomicrobium sp. GAS474]